MKFLLVNTSVFKQERSHVFSEVLLLEILKHKDIILLLFFSKQTWNEFNTLSKGHAPDLNSGSVWFE
jgi:hypothetical protein